MRKQVLFFTILALLYCVGSQPTHAQTEAKIKLELNDEGDVSTLAKLKNCHISFNQTKIYGFCKLVRSTDTITITLTNINGDITFIAKNVEDSSPASIAYGTEARWFKQACGTAIEKLPSHLYVQLAKRLELPDATLEQQLLSKVVLYDERTLKALHNSTKETQQSLLALVKNESPAFKDFMRMVPRHASKDTALLTTSWHQIDSVVAIVVGQNVAKVIVRESAFWESSGRVLYEAQNILHTYTLNLAGDEWLIVSDEF